MGVPSQIIFKIAPRNIHRDLYRLLLEIFPLNYIAKFNMAEIKTSLHFSFTVLLSLHSLKIYGILCAFSSFSFSTFTNLLFCSFLCLLDSRPLLGRILEVGHYTIFTLCGQHQTNRLQIKSVLSPMRMHRGTSFLHYLC